MDDNRASNQPAGELRTLTLTGVAMLALAANPLRRRERKPPDWRAVVTLFGYMIFFSFAYLSISVGTGALILFGAVLLAEPVTFRLVVSSVATLGGSQSC